MERAAVFVDKVELDVFIDIVIPSHIEVAKRRSACISDGPVDNDAIFLADATELFSCDGRCEENVDVLTIKSLVFLVPNDNLHVVFTVFSLPCH